MKRALLALVTLSWLAMPALAAVDTWETTGGPAATGTNASIIHALAVSPDGQTVYAGSGSGTVFRYLIGNAPINGVCDATNNGQTLTSAPASNLCTAGSASGVTSGNTAYNWSCAGSNGGGTASCSATRNYIVTSSAGANGSISASQTVAYNATPTFTLTPSAGYTGSAGGTCGGTLTGNSYTTNAVTASCTVVASFSLTPDTTPDPFSFTAQTGAALSSVATSNLVTVSGINSAAAISITGGTYSVNSGGYVSTAGMVNNGDTVTVQQTASASHSTLTTATLTIGGVARAFNVTTLAAPIVNPDPVPASPYVPPRSISIPGVGVMPVILDMSGGNGPDLLADLIRTLSAELGMSLALTSQSGSGAVVLSGFNGGNLAFVPLSLQTGDVRPNGIYPQSNGQYQIVTNGNVISIAPALVNLNQLAGLLPSGTLIQMEGNGVLSATIDGITYIVQPGALVQLLGNPGGVPQLLLGSDGFLHFTDGAGNSQILYPAFLDPNTLMNYLGMIDLGSSVNIQLEGTALIRLNGQYYTLAPDLTLGGNQPGHEGEGWWREGESRFWMRNRSHFGTTQGFTVR